MKHSNTIVPVLKTLIWCIILARKCSFRQLSSFSSFTCAGRQKCLQVLFYISPGCWLGSMSLVPQQLLMYCSCLSPNHQLSLHCPLLLPSILLHVKGLQELPSGEEEQMHKMYTSSFMYMTPLQLLFIMRMYMYLFKVPATQFTHAQKWYVVARV